MSPLAVAGGSRLNDRAWRNGRIWAFHGCRAGWGLLLPVVAGCISVTVVLSRRLAEAGAADIRAATAGLQIGFEASVVTQGSRTQL